MSHDAITLDQRIRAKAEKELQAEVERAFNGLIGYYSGGGQDANRLKLVVDGTTVVVLTDKDGEPEFVKLSLPDLLKALKAKAIENGRGPRGNEAITEFLERVESLGQEIQELRAEASD